MEILSSNKGVRQKKPDFPAFFVYCVLRIAMMHWLLKAKWKGKKFMQLFTKKVVEVIRNIPKGRVMTYGQIARVAGSPRAARQVVRVLHSMSRKHRLPWYRVINSKGQISLLDDGSYQEQLLSLESEGIEIGLNGVIDLQKYQYHPENN
ncbi:MAG TPA: MGMT family protein [Verrucomicrobiae bacterium]|nr:MGMT family protein [Verrucomicrobiae bacterium]